MNKKGKFLDRKKAQWNHFVEKHLHTKGWYRQLFGNKKGFNKYTIISACYNVEKYIAQYIESLINQRLDFKNNIFLICVDDGSTDRTADIIKGYLKKYPNNITYIYKENGGQASARNKGLEYVKTEWVSFCDPDDMLDYNAVYFVDEAIRKNNNLALVSMNFIFYREKTGRFEDEHPLRYRFNTSKVKKIANLGRDIQMSASAAFFRTEVINRIKIRQNELIKPSFEDSHFVAKYLSYVQDCRAAFLKDSKYFYRKREDNSSLLDKSWLDKRRFYDVFKYGYLDILEHYKKFCPASDYAKRICLYDYIWQLRRIVDHSEVINFLSEDEKNQYLSIVKKFFGYLEIDDVYNITLNDNSLFRKVGMINCFKNSHPKYDVILITQYDDIENEVRIVYFGMQENKIEVMIDDKIVLPTHTKTIVHDFCGEIFTKEKILWIPLHKRGVFRIFVDGKKAIESMMGVRYIDGLNTLKIIQDLRPKNIGYSDNKYNKVWLFSDRSDMADDNAEHLYRWIQNNHPEKKIYFIIKRESTDWDRLEKEKFNLIPFMSNEHKKALEGAAVVISSQANKTEMNPFDKKIGTAKFVFLQHGITKDDLHKWLNPKKIDLFVTSTKPEYESIIKSDFKYKFTSKEVKLLGLPRFDSLFLNNKESDNIILIMPTWRNYITEENFDKSDYKNEWFGLFYSDRLNELCKKYNYKVLIQLHPNMKKFVGNFVISENVQFSNGERYQNLFLKSKILITDYSSTAFDMAYLNKKVIYFQFDEEDFFLATILMRKVIMIIV